MNCRSPWRRGEALGVAIALLVGSCAGPAVAPLPSASDKGQEPSRYESFPDAAVERLYGQALERLQAGEEAEAAPLLLEVVTKSPEHVLAMGYYQDAAMHAGGEAEKAMRAHYDALPTSSKSPVPAFAKARLLGSNFARKAAIEQVLKEHPDFAYAWLAQARLLRGIGRLQEATASFQAAIQRRPMMLAAHVELAECFAELGRNAEAQQSYENYLRANPNDRVTVRSYVHLALYRNDNPKAARPWIERLLAEDPLDESVRMDLAACDWRAGNVDVALQGYLAALQQRPDNARAALNIGCIHFDAFGRDEATRRVHWPKARAAFRLFLQIVRPADGYDYFERSFAVPFRLKQIEELLGPAPEIAPSLDQLK